LIAPLVPRYLLVSTMSFFGFECSACQPSDPATSTVKVSLDRLAQEHQQKQMDQKQIDDTQLQTKLAEDSAKEQERLAREKAEEEARDRAREAEFARMEQERLLEQQRLFEEARAAEEERQLQEALEVSRREAEAAAAAAAAAEEERQRQEQERLAQERKAAVASFLKKAGFTGVNTVKKSMMSSTYALHKAAEAGDDKLVAMLLEEGAVLEQKNSSGKTAAQVAEKKNKNGSHAKVLEILSSSSAASAKCGGA